MKAPLWNVLLFLWISAVEAAVIRKGDCIVSRWSVAGCCPVSCGGGAMKITRTIIRHPTNFGRPCPQLVDTVLCNIEPCPDPKILIIGGSNHDAMSSMELYQPFNQERNRLLTIQMLQERAHHKSVSMPDNTVITLGGWNADRVILSSCERYTPSTDTVTECPSMLKTRENFAPAVLDRVVHVCGGNSGDGNRLKSCERLLSDGWENSVPMNTKRSSLAMVSLNGHLYAIGGWDGDKSLSSVERRSPSDKNWFYVMSMNQERWGHSAVVMQGNIFVCGGAVTYAIPSCERFDPIEQEWTEMPEMRRERWYFGLVTDGEHLFAIGGDDPGRRSVEMYSSKNNTWNMMPKQLRHERWEFSAVLIQ